MKKNYSILIIKNEKEKYLQYYDKRWNSWLFLNCKVENENDIPTIQEYIGEKLKVEKVNCRFLFDKIHKKFSQSDKVEKEYHHYFFEIKLEQKEILDNTDFEIAGIKYKYFSHEELLKDERIKEVNNDIIQFIKEYEDLNCK